MIMTTYVTINFLSIRCYIKLPLELLSLLPCPIFHLFRNRIIERGDTVPGLFFRVLLKPMPQRSVRFFFFTYLPFNIVIPGFLSVIVSNRVPGLVCGGFPCPSL